MQQSFISSRPIVCLWLYTGVWGVLAQRYWWCCSPCKFKKRSCSFSSALLDQRHWILLLLSFGQNLTQPCRCHLQVSRHLRAAAAEMHGLQRRDPPGAGHGPVLAPGPPGQEDHRGPRRPLAATLRATPTRGRRSSARMFTWGTSRGRLAEENPGLPKKTSGSNVFVELILCRMIRGALAPKAANCYWKYKQQTRLIIDNSSLYKCSRF